MNHASTLNTTGPDGKVIARGLECEGIKDAVAKVLEKAERGSDAVRCREVLLVRSLFEGYIDTMNPVLHSAEELLAKMSRGEKAQVLQWASQDVCDAWPGIEGRPDVCGGEACIVRTRIPVWVLEQSRRQGISEADLLRSYPTLTAQDLANTWAYARAHRAEIERDIAENEGA